MFDARILSTPFCSLFFSFCILNTQLKKLVLDPPIYILLSLGFFYISTLNISRTATPNLIKHFLKELNKTFQVPNLTILNKLQACNFIRKETLSRFFPVNFVNFFIEHLRTVVSENVTGKTLMINFQPEMKNSI